MVRNGKRISTLLICILCFLLLVGCGKDAQEEELYEEEIVEIIPEEPKGIEVQTEFFTFEYPAEWENKVQEIRTTEGNNSVTTFSTKISDRDVVLFSIILGPDDAEGYLLGWLKDGESEIKIYNYMNEMPAEDWTKEEYDEICFMQERVNEILIQFHEDPRFVPNR